MLTKQQIIDACDGKVSRALELMVEGLMDEERGFEIDFFFFGDKLDDTCFGCAATCATLKLYEKTNQEFVLPFTTRWYKDNDGDQDSPISLFEQAIDNARSGAVYKLFQFFDIETPEKYQDRLPIALENFNWKEELAQFQELIENLKREGF